MFTYVFMAQDSFFFWEIKKPNQQPNYFLQVKHQKFGISGEMKGLLLSSLYLT